MTKFGCPAKVIATVRQFHEYAYSSEIGTIKTGKITRMPDERLLKKILYEDL